MVKTIRFNGYVYGFAILAVSHFYPIPRLYTSKGLRYLFFMRRGFATWKELAHPDSININKIVSVTFGMITVRTKFAWIHIGKHAWWDVKRELRFAVRTFGKYGQHLSFYVAYWAVHIEILPIEFPSRYENQSGFVL